MKKRKTLAERAVEKQKKKVEKKAKRIIRHVLLGSLFGVFLLCTGYFLGVHHRVLAAWIKGEDLPEAPIGHCAHL